MAGSRLNQFFDAVFYINLDSRPERRRSVEAQLEHFGIEAERFAAIPKDNPEWGCFLSHQAIMQIAIERDLDNVFILEDDIVFDPEFEEKLAWLEDVPDDWEVLYLGGKRWVPYDSKKLADCPSIPKHVSGNCYRSWADYCCHSYAVRRSVCEYIVKRGFVLPIDTMLVRRYQKKESHNCYSIMEAKDVHSNVWGIVRQDDCFKSDLQEFRDERRYPFVCLERGIAHHKGKNGFEKDDKKAYEHWCAGAEVGNIPCMHRLADCYREGIGTEVDKEQADIWQRRADTLVMRRMGVDFMHCTGDAYYRGRDGRPVDYELAFKLWLRGAELGHLQCMKNVAWAYQAGVGTEKDKEAAQTWYDIIHDKEEAKPNHRFVIFTWARSGSNTLMRAFRCHPEVCGILGEPFASGKWAKFPQYYRDVTRESLDKVFAKADGFKHIYEQSLDTTPAILAYPDIKVILLWRKNVLRSIVSLYIAQQNGIWHPHMHHALEYPDEYQPIDIEWVRGEVRMRMVEYERVQAMTSRMSDQVVQVTYEELFGEEVPVEERLAALKRLYEFVGMHAVETEGIKELLMPDRKYNTTDTYRKIPNIDELEAAVGCDETGWLFK